MNRKLTMPAIAFALAFGAAGCDLAVTNPNDADRDRALASPGDVETLISSSYVSGYWEQAQYFSGLGPVWEISANHGSASWGNFGMDDAGREPRMPLMNQSSYTYAYVFEQPWADNYLGISGATDGIRAIDGGLEIGAGGADNHRAVTFATFVQGLSHCSLALQYDKAFILDENTDIEAEIASLPYDEVMTYALQKLDEAITLAQGGSFNLPETWFNGRPMSSAEFVALIRGYKARCRANLPRDPAERGSVDWAAVSADADAGLGDFLLDMEETGPWWSDIKYQGCGSEEGTWCRMHFDFAGQGDVSGNYQAWLDIPTQQRTPTSVGLLDFPDQRWPQVQADGEVGPFTSAIFPRGYYEFVSTIVFRPERGTYRQSQWGSNHYEDYVDTSGATGTVPEMLQTEMDLLMAEAALEMGDIPATVALVNQTRVNHGGLPAVVDGGTVPGGSTDCVPKKRFDPTGTCGDLRDALQWEHYNELFQVSSGLTFFFTRRQGELPAGTALHSPIPAAELEVLQEDIYTFGGDPGAPGSAGQPVLSVADRGADMDRVLQRVTRTLEVYDERRQEKLAHKAALRVR